MPFVVRLSHPTRSGAPASAVHRVSVPPPALLSHNPSQIPTADEPTFDVEGMLLVVRLPHLNRNGAPAVSQPHYKTSHEVGSGLGTWTLGRGGFVYTLEIVARILSDGVNRDRLCDTNGLIDVAFIIS